MNLERIQLAIAVLLSLTIHAGAALLGNFQFGSSTQPLGSLVVNIAAHSRHDEAQAPDISPSKPLTGAKSPPVAQTDIGHKPVQKSIGKQSVVNLDNLAAEAILKMEVKQQESKPELASLAPKSANKVEPITKVTTETDDQKSVAKQTKKIIGTKAAGVIDKVIADILKKPPLAGQLPKVMDKVNAEMTTAESGDQKKTHPVSAPVLSQIIKPATKKQALSKPMQFSSLAPEKKVREAAPSIPAINKSGILSKLDKTAIPLYHLIPKPVYPSRSRDLGETGTVILSILVGNDGSISDTYVSQSSGFVLLDASALDTVKSKWRFKPATNNGEPVASWVRVPIKFSLR